MPLKIMSDKELKKLISNNLKGPDPWKGTVYENLRDLHNKRKGEFGEILAANTAIRKGFTVKPATGLGHDRIFNGLKTEIKFSQATQNKEKVHTDNKFVINHLGLHKDWERFVFIGLNTDCSLVILHFTKRNAKNVVKDYFKPQQGGKAGKNDDYMCSISPTKLIKMQQDSRINTLLDPNNW